MNNFRFDHIEWAIAELNSISNRYKDYAVNWEQGERIDNCERAASLATKALNEIRSYLRNIPQQTKDDDYRSPESCFCAATKMPPCSWCTSPDRQEEDFRDLTKDELKQARELLDNICNGTENSFDRATTTKLLYVVNMCCKLLYEIKRLQSENKELLDGLKSLYFYSSCTACEDNHIAKIKTLKSEPTTKMATIPTPPHDGCGYLEDGK